MSNGASQQQDQYVTPSFSEPTRDRRVDEGVSRSDLIASNRVEGTQVYRPTGQKIGQVEYLGIEKRSGQVRVVVISFGGFLGMGKEHRPIPWDALNYNTTLEGYVLNASDDVLRAVPTIEEGDEIEWDVPYRQSVFSILG